MDEKQNFPLRANFNFSSECWVCGLERDLHIFNPDPNGDTSVAGFHGFLTCPDTPSSAFTPSKEEEKQEGTKTQGEGQVPLRVLSTSGVLDLTTLRDKGYLQEVNRVFFHPLGLALCWCHDDISDRLFVIDKRNDLEGMIFDGSEDLRPKAAVVESERSHRREARLQKLGYFVQPVEPSGASVERLAPGLASGPVARAAEPKPQHVFDPTSPIQDCSCGWRAPDGVRISLFGARKAWDRHAASFATSDAVAKTATSRVCRSRFFSAHYLAELLAEKLQIPSEDLVLQWDVGDDGEFLGVIIRN